MTDPLIDAANAISDASPAIKTFAQLAAQRIIALEPTPPPAPSPGPPSPAGTAVPFGTFADGTIGGEINDTTWNWFAPHVKLTPKGALLVADDSMTFPNAGPNVRIHGIQFKGGARAWQVAGHECWRQITVTVPSGYGNPYPIYACDELHGANGTGPAPYNLAFQRGGFWRIYVRGSQAPPAFAQWVFGQADGAEYGGTFYRHHQDWKGGNKAVVLDEPVTFFLHWKLAPDATGSFEAWARWPGSDLRNIVPTMTGIPTCYPGVLTPYMGLYYPVGGGGQNAVILSQGAWWGK